MMMMDNVARRNLRRNTDVICSRARRGGMGS